MKVYSRYPSTGELILVKSFPETPPSTAWLLDMSLGFMRALNDVVRARTIKMWLAYRPIGAAFLLVDPEPEHSLWRIDAVSGQAAFVPDEPDACSASALAPDQLGDEEVRAWVRHALDNTPAEGNFEVTIGQLSPADLDTRIFDSLRFIEDDRIRIEAPGAVIDVPVVSIGDEVWLTSGLDRLGLTAPVSFVLSYEEARITAYISVTWARWTEVGTSEHVALKQALQDLVLQGWASQRFVPWLDQIETTSE